MPRYKLTVAYDGTHFHGWQKQRRTADNLSGALDPHAQPNTARDVPPAGDGPLRTVQHVLEMAVRRVVREPVQVIGASRTDAGVHARGQVAAFTSHLEIPPTKIARAVSSRLPDDVQVRHAEIVPDDFDPIGGAIAKGYQYRIAHSCVRGKYPLFNRYYLATTHYKLDPVRMNEAARMFLGEHDFTSFARINHRRESPVRMIYECKVTATSRQRCKIDIAGNGFLYNMVRIIAGTLVEVGRGAIEPQAIETILVARNRDAAGPTLPACGLCLMWIRYPDCQSQP
jgi:tRNA pseudouridine38-40 synthase